MTRSSLVEEMIKLIRPDPGCEARCRKEIGEGITRIERAHKEKLGVDPPVAEIKAQMAQLHGALEKVGLLVSQLNSLARTILFYDGRRDYPEGFSREECMEYDHEWRGGALNSAEFAREVGYLTKRTGEFANAFESPKAAPRRSEARVRASQAAYLLIAGFASSPPTLTKRGRFFRLASMLFEAATGERQADLTRDCRKTFGDYSQIARPKFMDPTALPEWLTRLTSPKRRPTKRTDG
jgi:hypothetical protein